MCCLRLQHWRLRSARTPHRSPPPPASFLSCMCMGLTATSPPAASRPRSHTDAASAAAPLAQLHSCAGGSVLRASIAPCTPSLRKLLGQSQVHHGQVMLLLVSRCGAPERRGDALHVLCGPGPVKHVGGQSFIIMKERPIAAVELIRAVRPLHNGPSLTTRKSGLLQGCGQWQKYRG